MPRTLTIFSGLVVLAASLGACSFAHAQASDPAAVQEVRKAVAAELEASKTDKSIWMYQERDTTPEKNALYDTVETSQGTLKRLIELNGRTLTGKAQQTELQRVENYVHDTSAQARARRSAAHDDAQAAEMLKMLPNAFIWTRGEQTGDSETLKYRPNPDFDPPNMQARVMSIMAGEMIIALPGHRIRTLRGALRDNVLIGFGILGKLDRGGTFEIERRMVGDSRWQITETRVHIGGHALLFKTIGQQEDDIKTNWRPSPAHTLEEAAQILAASHPGHP
jgi:hypothetical protein